LQNEKDHYQKNKFSITLATTLLLVISWLPNAKAITGQEVAVKMGLSIAGAIAGKSVNMLVFPSQGIDYKKIRIMMEKVIRKNIIDSEIAQVEGELKGLNSRVYATLSARNLPPLDRFERLEHLSEEIGRLVDRISGDYFAEESIATYMMGAQVELTIISAMYLFAKDAEDGGKMDFSDMLFNSRLFTHYSQMDYVTKLGSDLLWDRYRRIGCTQYGSYKVWLQDNYNGTLLVRNWYNGWTNCNNAAAIYREHVYDPFKADLASTPKFGWLNDIKKNWLAIGRGRGIFD
jgi:hypothetical protein